MKRICDIIQFYFKGKSFRNTREYKEATRTSTYLNKNIHKWNRNAPIPFCHTTNFLYVVKQFLVNKSIQMVLKLWFKVNTSRVTKIVVCCSHSIYSIIISMRRKCFYIYLAVICIYIYEITKRVPFNMFIMHETVAILRVWGIKGSVLKVSGLYSCHTKLNHWD